VVHRFAWRRLDNEADAQDAVAETMLQVWHSAARFEGRSSVKTWVLGIAKYKIADVLRARGMVEMQDIEDMQDELPDDAPQVFEQLVQRQNAQLLSDCIAVLPDVQQECLHLAVLEGLSLADIGDMLGVPSNTVATRIHHAKIKLRTCVQRALGLLAPQLAGAAL